jgi:uncharacterized protein YndB with AHSA1/START domain
MNNEPLIFERTYDAPIEKVWQALTDSEKMKSWYFDLPGFKPEVGYEFTFTGGPEEGVQYVHLCSVTEAIPNEKIAYTWRYDGYPGNSEVSFELFDDNGKTRLKLVHDGLETFPANNPDFAKSNFNEGWTYFVGALGDYLAK